MKHQVRPATSNDVDLIVQIACEHELASKDNERIAKEGFLVSGYAPEKYLTWLEHLAVSEAEGRISGFTLTFSRNELPSVVDDSDQVFKAAGDGDFFLFKQVGVSVAFQGTGAGSALYQYELDKLSCPALAPIVLDPRNVRSIAFHEKLGFSQVAEYPGVDGKARGIWKWLPSNV